MSGGFCFLTLSIRELQREKDKEIKKQCYDKTKQSLCQNCHIQDNEASGLEIQLLYLLVS